MTTPDFELYPDELTKVAQVMTKLSNAFDFTHFTETNKAIFEMAVAEEFASIGLLARVNWQEITTDKGSTGVLLPGVEPYGRTRQESEADHDRIKWGVTQGLADGQAGFIREDGSKSEEPIKKIITS